MVACVFVVTLLNSLKESRRGLVQFLCIADLSGPAINFEMCLFCP